VLVISVSGGSISTINFKRDDLDNLLIGDDFVPSDFNIKTPIVNSSGNIIGSNPDEYGFIITIPSQTNGGKSAIIRVVNGIVWLKKAKDKAPIEQVPVTRLSISSAAGQKGYVQGGKENTFDLAKNSSSKYDCFYHFHNDVSHTLGLSRYGAGMGSYLQFINLTIS
jgi:hypothetical protein